MASVFLKLFFVYFLLFFTYAFGHNQEKETLDNKTNTIYIATEEYPPYSSILLKDFGINSRLITEAFALVDIKVVFEFLPSARSFKMTKEGKYDATMPWAKREGREHDFDYSDPLLQSDTEHFYYLKNNPISWDIKKKDYTQLKGTVGSFIGYNFGKEFNDAVNKGQIKVEKVVTLSQNFNMLLKNRIGQLICQKKVCDYILKTKFTQEQRDQILSVPQNTDPVEYDYLLFSKKSSNAKNFRLLFNKGLKMLKHTNRYHTIIHKDFDDGYYKIIDSKEKQITSKLPL